MESYPKKSSMVRQVAITSAESSSFTSGGLNPPIGNVSFSEAI